MTAEKTSSSNAVLVNLRGLLPELETLYTDLHAHPELPMEEVRTAGLAANRLRAAGYDVGATERVVDAFRAHFRANRIQETRPTSASEDFGSFGTEWHAPSVFWFVGGTDPAIYAKAKETGRVSDIPTNHSPQFAPAIHPTLETGVEALVVAAQAWLFR